MLLRLEPSADAEWNRLDRKIRNQVRKAEKNGLTAAVGGVELLPAFYAIFARNMRDLGTPVYSVRFFREVFAAFPDAARVCLVRQGSTPFAASIVLSHGRRMEVPWASALRESNPLSANVLLYWRMLQLAIEGGVEVFDFGRSTPGEGTFAFKKQWGAEPLELVWEYWTGAGRRAPDLSPKNPKFSAAIRLWQHLPLPVANVLGPRIVRHIP
jgi:FemAB-related protein (PEP-CTERM system-associated)